MPEQVEAPRRECSIEWPLDPVVHEQRPSSKTQPIQASGWHGHGLPVELPWSLQEPIQLIESI